MVLLKPSDRPEEVSTLPELKYDTDKSEWRDDPGASLPSCERYTVGGMTVVAEDTRLSIRAVSGKSEEFRSSLVAPLQHSDQVGNRADERFFSTIHKGLVERYPIETQVANDLALAVKNIPLLYDSPGADWVAFNPRIASEMGWRCTNGGLFRWVDQAGNLMVESIWWTDGEPDFNPMGGGFDEVGSGWLVVGAESAIVQLEARFGPLSRISRVVRRIDGDEQNNERSDQSIQPLNRTGD